MLTVRLHYVGCGWFPGQRRLRQRVLKVSTSGHLAVADYFNPYNTAQESNDDEDLGSGGALVLPGLRDAFGRLQHLAVGAGKDSSIYVVDRINGETSFFAEARVLVDQGIAWRESAEGGKKRRRWHA